MKLPKNLYSRLTLITVATVVTWYAIIYAYTAINSAEYASWAPLTSTLMWKIVGNIDELNTKISNFSFSAGNVIIGSSTELTGSKFKVIQTADNLRTAFIKSTSPTTWLNYWLTVRAWTNSNDWGLLVMDKNEGSYQFYVRWDGNVWIWTASPGAKLHLNGGNSQITNNISRLILQDTQTSWATYEVTSGWSAVGNFDILKSWVASRMTIDTNGNVGVGTTAPAYKLQVMWSVASNSTVLTSDQRYKKNITPINNSLDKVLKLNWVTFDWRADEFKNKNFPEWKQVWFIAQEVEKVIPEVVTTDGEWYKWVEYANITALLVNAIKEQQKQIEELKSEVRELRNR